MACQRLSLARGAKKKAALGAGQFIREETPKRAFVIMAFAGTARK
jgi:hypothetical protein